jgi:hypothetical protein
LAFKTEEQHAQPCHFYKLETICKEIRKCIIRWKVKIEQFIPGQKNDFKMNISNSQRQCGLRLNPEARGLRGSFCSGSRLTENFQDFLLITKNVTIAPTTSKHITIPAIAPPCSLECWLRLSDESLLVLLGGAGR